MMAGLHTLFPWTVDSDKEDRAASSGQFPRPDPGAESYRARVVEAMVTDEDCQTAKWWSKPLRLSIREEQARVGVPLRPLRVATLCSGTEAVLLAMQERF